MVKLILISIVTLPLAIGWAFVTDTILHLFFGGLRVVKGFPLPYYIDEWSKPGLELNLPIINFINIFFFYFSLTWFTWNWITHIRKQKTK